MIRENALQPREALIEAVRWENADTFTLDLSLKNGHDRRRYSFLPGQFNMLNLMGYEEAPISLASAVNGTGTFQHTVKAVGRFTEALGRLKAGDSVGLRGPYGVPWPVEELKGKNLLAIAGGIGLAPLRSLLQHIFGHRDQYGKVTILYGAKKPGDVIYADELDVWRSRPDTTLGITVDRLDQPAPTPSSPRGPNPAASEVMPASGSSSNVALTGPAFRSPAPLGAVPPAWPHHVGVVPTLFQKVPVSAEDTLALICGPEVMLKFVLIDLFKRGFAPDHIYVSMERRMRCGVAQCGHCMFGPRFVCRDGPVFRFDNIQHLFGKGV